MSAAKITATVNLSRPVTGQQLMDAVREAAGDGYHQQTAEINDGHHLYEVGYNTKDWSRDCVVLGDGGNVDLAKEYATVVVHFHEHDGAKYANHVGEDNIANRMRIFADKVSDILNR